MSDLNLVLKKIPELQEFPTLPADALAVLYDPATSVTGKIKAALLQGGIEANAGWVSTFTYSLDEICEYGLKWWKSKVDSNTGNIPAEGTYWTEVSKSTANGFGAYVAGVFTINPSMVIKDKYLYLCNPISYPFNSTNFQTEYNANRWILLSGDVIFKDMPVTVNATKAAKWTEYNRITITNGVTALGITLPYDVTFSVNSPKKAMFYIDNSANSSDVTLTLSSTYMSSTAVWRWVGSAPVDTLVANERYFITVETVAVGLYLVECNILDEGGTGGGHIIVDGAGVELPQQPKLKIDGIPITDGTDFTYIDLYLKAVQNVGICQQCPILPIDIVIDHTALTLTIATIKGGETISAANPIRWFTDGGGIIVKHELDAPAVFTFTKTTGVWYFHLDANGDAIATQVPWSNFDTIATVYRFYLNATLANSEMVVVRAWEAHLNTISAVMHSWMHAQGTIYLNGFEIVDNAIATGAPNADGRNTVISLTGGSNSDDGLEYTVISDTTPTGKFEQDLGHTTAATLTALNSGLFKIRTNDINGILNFLPATGFPFAWDTGTNKPQYITSTGVRTIVTEDHFFVYFLYALQDDAPGEAIKSVSAAVDFATLADAQAYSWEQLQALYPTLRDNEIRPLYKGIWLFNSVVPSAFDVGCKYSVLREKVDIRKQKVTSVSTSGGSVLSSNVIESAALPNLETSAGASQAVVNAAANARVFEQIAFALSGYDVDVTTASQDILKSLPFAFKAYTLRAEFATAPTGSSAIVTFYKNGVSIGTVTILATEFAGETAISTVLFAKGDSLSAVVTQIGLTVPGKTAKAYIQGVKYQ